VHDSGYIDYYSSVADMCFVEDINTAEEMPIELASKVFDKLKKTEEIIKLGYKVNLIKRF
jgi:hypothetical protein